MDGVLLIDKPAGPTSHDVVARLRAVSGERAIGHTGTLDPRATGLLPLVLGKATRLSSVLTGGDKVYDAVIRLGVTTETNDGDGQVTSTWAGALPDTHEIERALDRFRGAFDQTPPSHSAKKVGGQKAYDLARRDAAVELAPVPVTVHSLEFTGRTGDLVSLTIAVSTGFYVRALARDLGTALGCGGSLHALRRTKVGAFDLSHALPLADAERLGRDIERRLIPPAEALADLPAVVVTEAGLKRAVHGNPLNPEHLTGRSVPAGHGRVRVLAPDGHLVALAHARSGALHPAVVLG